MNERADENPNPLDGLEAHEAVQLILHHLQAALPPLLTAWALYQKFAKEQRAAQRKERHEREALEAADYGELSADRWELYAMSSAGGRVASPPGTGWFLYSLRLESAPGEDGWAVHTVWKRRLVGVGSVEN